MRHARHRKRSDFKFDLPEELIAQEPLSERTDSRLLELTGTGIRHRTFRDITDLLRADDLIVLNDTKVIKARLRGVKDSGGNAEILIERVLSENLAKCQVQVSKPLKEHRTVHVGDLRLKVIQRTGEFYILEFPLPVFQILERFGETPIPPYIKRPAAQADEERYQTVYSKTPGAVAAPTAGLHFSDALLQEIQTKGVDIAYVTLHVGAGTFQPVRVENLDDHQMHTEYYAIPEQTQGMIQNRKGRVIAVGTTVVRTLESWAKTGQTQGETDLFISPGFEFKLVDCLITNFHLPESSLLMLVSAFSGYEQIRAAYSEAVAKRYRFFSYGDAMYCERE